MTDAERDRQARVAAVEARLGNAGGSDDGAASLKRQKEEKEHLLKLRRIIDLQIRRDNTYERAAGCLRLLDTLLHNILEHPADLKYRSFKAENPRISRTLLDVSGGIDYLVQAGFGRRTVDFKAEWYVAPPESMSTWGWRKLELAGKVLRDRLGEAEWRADLEKERKSREDEEEKGRVKRALLEAEEDRNRVAQRVERERRARGPPAAAPARSSQDHCEGEGEPGSTMSNGPVIGTDDYSREVPFDAPSERSAQADEADEDGEEPPPYGQQDWGSGRRLGG
ncbi:unnamed protein product [Parajaminaea phylloscopi]